VGSGPSSGPPRSPLCDAMDDISSFGGNTITPRGTEEEVPMFRKLLTMAAAVLVPMGLFVIADSGTAVAGGPPKAMGIANCHISSGSGTLTPGLTPLGTKGYEKVTFTASLTFPAGPCANSNVTFPSGVTILGGTVTGSGIYRPPAGGNASACPNFDGPDILRHIKVTIHWLTSGPPIAPTKIVYTGNPGTVSGAPTDTITLDTPPALTAIKTGSFAAPPTLHTVQLNTNIPGPGCGPGPYTTFNVSGGVVTV
jgi:hypothetical protein